MRSILSLLLAPLRAGVCRFGGDSSSAATTWQQDNRRAIGEGGISAEGSSVSVTNNLTTLPSADAEIAAANAQMATDVVDTAIAGNTATAYGAVNAMGGTTAQALSFGSDALALAGNAVTDNTAQAFSFGSDALATAANAITGAQYTQSAALDFAGNVVNGAAGAVSSLVAGALSTAGDAFNGALNATSQAQTQAFDFGTDALAGAFNFGTDAMSAVTFTADTAMTHAADARTQANNLARGTLDVATDTFAGAFNFGADQSRSALNAVADAWTGSASMVKDAYADAQGRGALTDKMLMLAIAVMGLVAVFAVKKG